MKGLGLYFGEHIGLAGYDTREPWAREGRESILDGRLELSHLVTSRQEGSTTITTTRFEITARNIRDIHLIEYVIAALAIADLPTRKWDVFHDGGSARLVFSRPGSKLCIGDVVKLRHVLKSLATPTTEPAHVCG